MSQGYAETVPLTLLFLKKETKGYNKAGVLLLMPGQTSLMDSAKRILMTTDPTCEFGGVGKASPPQRLMNASGIG
jgi:hypothetical protein